MRHASPLVVLLLSSTVPAADIITLEVNPKESSGVVEICVQRSCDADSSAVGGFVQIELDDPVAPSEILLDDFSFDLLDPISLELSVIGGAITINGPDISAVHSLPGTPVGPGAIEGTTFLIPDVPFTFEGMVNYNATGTACILLQQQGLPCNGTIDLSLAGSQTVDVEGDISIDEGFATLASMPEISVPFDPTQPDLAVLNFMAMIIAEGVIPTAGDGDNDGDVDIDDFEGFVTCFTGPDNGPVPIECVAFDIDDDGDVDFLDYSEFQLLFTGSL